MMGADDRRNPEGLWIAVCGVLLLSACSPGPSGEQPRANLLLEEDLRLGAVDGPTALNSVLGMAGDQAGNVYVTQWQVPHVTVFGPGGELAGTVGRRGQGPGELTQPRGIGLLGDTLWVSSQGRVARFRTDGAFIGQAEFRRGLSNPRLSYWPARYLAGGVLVAEVAAPSSLAASGELGPQPVLVVTPQGDILDTLAMVDVAANMIEIRLEGRQIYTQVPELAGPGYVYSPDGRYLVLLETEVRGDDTGVLRAIWVNTSGDSVDVKEQGFVPQSVDPAMKEAVVARLAGPWSERFAIPYARMHDTVEDQIRWPAYQPLYSGALVDADQRLWMRREVDGDSVRWEVWSRDSAATAEVWMPSDLELEYVGQDQLWGMRRDELDVPYLYRYRVVKSR